MKQNLNEITLLDCQKYLSDMWGGRPSNFVLSEGQTIVKGHMVRIFKDKIVISKDDMILGDTSCDPEISLPEKLIIAEKFIKNSENKSNINVQKRFEDDYE